MYAEHPHLTFPGLNTERHLAALPRFAVAISLQA